MGYSSNLDTAPIGVVAFGSSTPGRPANDEGICITYNRNTNEKYQIAIVAGFGVYGRRIGSEWHK